MANATYYVDLSDGNDTTGNGTTGTPWKTIGKATTSNLAHSSGDTVTVKVRPVNSGGSHTLTSGNRFATTTSHNGINWVIEPDTGEGNIICDTLYPVFTTQVGGSLTLRKFQWTGAQQWFCYSNSGQLSVSLDQCIITSTFNAIGESLVRSAAAGANVTITGCTLSNYKYWLLQATTSHAWGAIAITGNTPTDWGGPGMARPGIENPFVTLTMTGNNVTGKTGCTYGLLTRTNATPSATSIVITDNVFDYATAASPTTEGAFIRVNDADSGITGTLAVTISGNTINWTGIDGHYAVSIGNLTSNQAKATTEAAMSGKLGLVTVADNVINATTGGLVKLGLGVNDAIFEDNTLAGTAVAHNVQLVGKRISMKRNTIAAANLPCMVFGDDCVIENNTITGDRGGILIGKPSGTSLEYGTGNTVRFNTVTSLSSSADDFCISDYAYNIGEPTVQDNVVDYNRYAVPNGASIGRISGDDVKASTMQELRAAWEGYGPDGNDVHSSLVGAGGVRSPMSLGMRLGI